MSRCFVLIFMHLYVVFMWIYLEARCLYVKKGRVLMLVRSVSHWIRAISLPPTHVYVSMILITRCYPFLEYKQRLRVWSTQLLLLLFFFCIFVVGSNCVRVVSCPLSPAIKTTPTLQQTQPSSGTTPTTRGRTGRILLARHTPPSFPTTSVIFLSYFWSHFLW